MLYYKDLEEKVLSLGLTNQPDELCIISGYVGCDPIEKLKDLPENVHVTVIYGMYGNDNISAPLHKALLGLQQELPNVEILYSTVPVHSKIYFSLSGNSIQSVLIGSANFSVSGLRNNYKEVLSDVGADIHEKLQVYYDYVRSRSIPCTSAEIKVREIFKARRTTKFPQPLIAHNICRATFFDKNGVVPKMSGINWCCSKGHVAEGDAYIPIKKEYIDAFPKMFPPKKYVNGVVNANYQGNRKRENDLVELIWDDGTIMTGLLEGQIYDKKEDMYYPKQLSSSPQKSILGKYLRQRLGVSLNHVVTKADLIKYGRTHIDISLIAEGIYYMEFSTNK